MWIACSSSVTIKNKFKDRHGSHTHLSLPTERSTFTYIITFEPDESPVTWSPVHQGTERLWGLPQGSTASEASGSNY